MQKITLDNVTITIQKEKINPIVDGLMDQIQNMEVAELLTKVDAIYNLLGDIRFIAIVASLDDEKLIKSFCVPLLPNIVVITKDNNLVSKFSKKMIEIVSQDESQKITNRFFLIHAWATAKGMSHSEEEEMLNRLLGDKKEQDNNSLPIFVVGRQNGKYDGYRLVTVDMIKTDKFELLLKKNVLEPGTIKSIDDIVYTDGSNNICVENFCLCVASYTMRCALNSHIYKNIICIVTDYGGRKIAEDTKQLTLDRTAAIGNNFIHLFIRSDIQCS